MKILKERSRIPWWVGYKHSCGFCGVEYELELTDAAVVEDKFVFATVPCPSPGCNSATTIDNREELFRITKDL